LKPVIRKLGRHETSNENGIRATDFCPNNNNIIKSRYIPASQKIQTGTLQSPATRSNNPMEHVWANGRHASSIMMLEDVEVQTDSEHLLVLRKYRQKIPKQIIYIV
jgi:hypothetical protein